MSITDTTQHVSSGSAEQLSLLAVTDVPLQFRLDERTRRRGLQHVAELRAQIEAQAALRKTPATAQGTPVQSTVRPARQIAA